MKITRIYSDDDGETHFEDLAIGLNAAVDIGILSGKVPVKNIIFRENKPYYDYDWHNAPKKQYIIMLNGEIR